MYFLFWTLLFLFKFYIIFKRFYLLNVENSFQFSKNINHFSFILKKQV